MRIVCFTQPEADDYLFSFIFHYALIFTQEQLLNDRTSLISSSHSCYYTDVECLTFVSSISERVP